MTITGVTADDVYNITGVSVDQAQVNQALAMIEMKAGVGLSDFTRFAAANRSWLQKAVAYQAAWMSTQVDIFSRSDFSAMTQDGMSITPRTETSMWIAPLAQMALSRVSWVRPRSIRVKPGRHIREANRRHAGDLGVYEGGSDALYRSPGQPYTEADWDNATGEGDWL